MTSRRLSRARRWSWGVLAGLVLGLLSLASTAFAQTAAWTAVTIPGSDANTNGVLEAGTLRTASDGWAVGPQYGTAGNSDQPNLAYHWNGSTWSRVSTPTVTGATTSGLFAVSASSATDAWAVGDQQLPFTGYHGATSLFEHWNGSAWSVVPGANGGQLVGVSDLGPTQAWAVSSEGLVENWNGTAWSLVTTPAPNPSDTVGNILYSLSADSPSDVWALGTFAQQSTDPSSLYVLHYNGTAWTDTVLPEPAIGEVLLRASAIDAVAPNDVWVAGSGDGGAYVEHFNGTAWSELPLPSTVYLPSLTTIVASSATDAWVVGHAFASATSTTPINLYLNWNGTSWSTAPSPTGTSYSSVYGAAAAPGAPFWAFGNNPGNQPMILTHP